MIYVKFSAPLNTCFVLFTTYIFYSNSPPLYLCQTADLAHLCTSIWGGIEWISIYVEESCSIFVVVLVLYIPVSYIKCSRKYANKWKTRQYKDLSFVKLIEGVVLTHWKNTTSFPHYFMLATLVKYNTNFQY